MIAADWLFFLRSWMADPIRVAAVTPSGASLARLITREILPANGPVLELGAGTGVFTRAIVDRGVSEDDLTLVEYGSGFAEVLRHRFPRARVLQLDAARLGREGVVPPGDVGTVVSGLPLLTLSPRTCVAILRGAFSVLKPAGSFYQFTYGYWCPVSRRVLERLGLEATRVGVAFKNLPPASVYRISRCPPQKRTTGSSCGSKSR